MPQEAERHGTLAQACLCWPWGLRQPCHPGLTLPPHAHWQAATWHLVWCLYCNEMPPVGTGGPEVLDTGGRRSARQILADKVSADPALTR